MKKIKTIIITQITKKRNHTNKLKIKKLNIRKLEREKKKYIIKSPYKIAKKSNIIKKFT